MSFNKIIFLLLTSFIINGCTEPYILETNTYEEALVVEATITNELKKQEIIVSKTAQLEDKEIKTETGAIVYITDNTGLIYIFEEMSGKYVSKTEFQALPEREYQLSIITSDGRKFQSSTEKLAPINPIQDLKAFVETKDSIRGVAIHVYNYDPSEKAKYYRYKFEETYKIVAPYWTTQKAIVIPGPNPTIQLIRNSIDTRVCYGSKNSTDFILTSTTGLNENRLDFTVRFISDQNYILSHRYSILVYQYVENLAAYTYYKTLKKISDSGTLLSPLQPGFFYGNIKSTTNPDDKVIGFFDVSSVTTKRMFFNYIDLFPNESLPPYYTECEELKMTFCDGAPDCNADDLIYGFTTNTLTYYRNLGNSYRVYNAPCGDCTTFASGVKPPFWID